MLKLEEIRKRYHHDQGLKNINLTVLPENIYLFVGENGSGKSTTIKLISHVIFHSQRDGKITNQFKKIVYLPDKRSYPRLLTVKTYLTYFLEKKMSSKLLDTWLEKYQIPNKKIGGLSKGMLQKLGIIQTLLSEGDLYLFDEPTDGLDTDSIHLFKEDLMNLLNQKKTIIVSTHNKQIYKELKPKIYHFNKGVCYEKK